MLNVEQTWRARIDNPRYNTSYPLNPLYWGQYRISGSLPFTDSRCAFYFHIPFCARLCSFCEYTRMTCPAESLQIKYLHTLARDVERFRSGCGISHLCGFDIGGGTPTVLSDDAFSYLMEIYLKSVKGMQFCDDYEASIEGTFHSISEHKLIQTAKCGIYRLSLGVQTSVKSVLAAHNRAELGRERLVEKMEMIRAGGIRKINLDLMYGLNGQTEKSINSDMETIAELAPDQVTLYEWRTNMLAVNAQSTAAKNYEAYCMYYELLKQLGYHARFGQNTFSRSSVDYGCSSYLRHRMLSACAYKGFGISAQSMSPLGISYNAGKNAAVLPLSAESFEVGDTYILPPAEIAAKYIAISAYYGGFSLSRVTELLHYHAEDFFEKQIRFVLHHNLMQQDGDYIYITRHGYRYYGATFSLFYAPIES